MANYQQGWQHPQQGWQYPQPPSYPQGPVVPGSMAQPTRPAAMRWAVSLMYVGAALSLAYALVSGIVAHGVTLTNSTQNSAYNAGFVGGAVIEGLAQVALWLWMAWKTGTGRVWARILSTVFYGLLCLQLIIGLAAFAINKGAGTPAVVVILLVQWGVGLAALIQLWRRESSDFFAFAKRAQLAAAAAAYYGYGYQPFGYGQARPYGQPRPDGTSPQGPGLQP
jgi:hypothetical protein